MFPETYSLNSKIKMLLICHLCPQVVLSCVALSISLKLETPAM